MLRKLFQALPALSAPYAHTARFAMEGCFHGCPGGGGGGGGGDAYRQLLQGFFCSAPGGHYYKEEQAPTASQLLQQHLHKINMQMNEEEVYIPGDHPLPEPALDDYLGGVPSPSSSSLMSLPDATEVAATGAAPLAPLLYDQCTSTLQFPAAPAMGAAPSGRPAMGAFRPYVRHLGPKKKASKGGGGGQRMSKMVISLLTRMYMMRLEYEVAAAEAAAQPSANQLQHMISERKRREKLNESFRALKTVLPPGSKKDKTSILLRAKDYVNALKARASELEEKNRMLQSKLLFDGGGEDGDDAGEEVEIEMKQATECGSELQGIAHLKIQVRPECNMADVVLGMLQCLKEMGDFSLVAMNTSSGVPRARATLTLQLKSSNWDEQLLKESARKVIKNVLLQSEAAPSPFRTHIL